MQYTIHERDVQVLTGMLLSDVHSGLFAPNTSRTWGYSDARSVIDQWLKGLETQDVTPNVQSLRHALEQIAGRDSFWGLTVEDAYDMRHVATEALAS